MLMRALGPAQNMNIQVVYAINREHIIDHASSTSIVFLAPRRCDSRPDLWRLAACNQASHAHRHSS